MPSQDDVKHQQNLLDINRRNLAHYLRQQDTLGAAYTPPGIVNGILEARANIKRIKGILSGWGKVVEDHPDDDEQATQSSSTAPISQRAATQIGRDQIDARVSQGFIANSSGPVSQNFGDQQSVNAGTVIYIQGGDFRGTNLASENAGRNVNQGGAASMSAFDQRGWNVAGNVYNIAGDLNISANSSKDEFLTALRQFKSELDKAQDLPADKADDLKEDVDSAIKAIDKPNPNKERAVERLTTIQKVLDGLKGSATSALALGKLVGQMLLAAQGISF